MVLKINIKLFHVNIELFHVNIELFCVKWCYRSYTICHVIVSCFFPDKQKTVECWQQYDPPSAWVKDLIAGWVWSMMAEWKPPHSRLSFNTQNWNLDCRCKKLKELLKKKLTKKYCLWSFIFALGKALLVTAFPRVTREIIFHLGIKLNPLGN